MGLTLFSTGYYKNRTDLYIIHEENDVIETEKLARVKKQLNLGEHACLIMRMDQPRAYEIRWVLQQNCYKTPINRLQHSCQHSCQEIAALLSRDYSTPVKRLQHFSSVSTTIKRSQYFCQENTALLSAKLLSVIEVSLWLPPINHNNELFDWCLMSHGSVQWRSWGGGLVAEAPPSTQLYPYFRES